MNKYEAYELFLMYYPGKERTITDQINIGDNEYMFYINDGRRVRFDAVEHTMSYIKYKDNLTYEELDTIWINEFSRKLKKKLKLNRFTQKDFANEIGVTERTIHNYINGKSIPDYLILRRIARILDCTIEDLTNFDYLL